MLVRNTQSFARRLFRRSRRGLTAAPKESRWLAIRRQIHRRFQKLVGFDAPRWVVDTSASASQARALTYRDYVNPLRWCAWTCSFAWSWLLTRQYSKIAGALPALLAGASVVGLLAFALVSNPTGRLSQYRGMFDAAIESQNYPAALTTIGALVDASPDNADLLYQQAVVLDLYGRQQEATDGMQSLVELHRHPLAALWMISKQCDLKTLAEWEANRHTQFRRWMDIALSGVESDNRTASKILMASYLVAIGAKSEAIRYYDEIVPEHPELALSAASICKEQFNEDRQRRFAIVAEKYYSQRLMTTPGNTDVRIGLVQTLMLNDRVEEAAKLLNDGLRLTKDRRLASLLGSVLAVWESQLQRAGGSENLAKRLQVLHAAIRVAPNDAIVGQALVKCLLECRNSQDPGVVAMRTALLKGDAFSTSHFIRGTLALLSNRFDESMNHFQLASDQPNVPSMMNNFAVAISQTSGGNLQHALQLSHMALEKQPQHPYFLETRGQIFTKLQRWNEAIADLEAALDAPELGPMVFPSLAKAYHGVGETEIAEHFEQKTSSFPGEVNKKLDLASP